MRNLPYFGRTLYLLNYNVIAESTHIRRWKITEINFIEWKLFYIHWLPNTYKYEKEFVVPVMIVPVFNI